MCHDVTFQPLVFPLRQNGDSQLNWDFINDHGLPIEEEDIEKVDDNTEPDPVVMDEEDEVIPYNIPSRDIVEEDPEPEIGPEKDQGHEEDPPPRRSTRDRRPV